ncbi:pilus assembly protein TadG-related protein [Tessaracoccus sp.]
MKRKSRDAVAEGQPRRPGRALRERGAVTVLVALLIPVLFGAMALALDYGKLVTERQELSIALDAAALAGVRELPKNPVAAEAAARKFAKDNDPKANPTINFWCVVASSGSARTVASGQVPGVCNPGSLAKAQCDEFICAIPCPATAGNVCNAVNVTDGREVQFAFGPVIGISTGNTGALSATACRGGCGAMAPNPMDVALVADRTGSMSDSNRRKMVEGIKSSLQTMTKEQQYVALGTIHRSSNSAPQNCLTDPSTSLTLGPWIPVGFSNDYTATPSTPGARPPLNSSSRLVQALNCMKKSPSHGTHLASPMKSAARYVLGEDPNNLGSLPEREDPARKAIIFETDGQPNEQNTAGSTSLNTPDDIGSTNGDIACSNLAQVAANAKARGVLIVTVAFGDASSARCSSRGAYVRDVLAAAASPDDDGNPSVADNSCSTSARRATENADGDFFFCAATGEELGPIFISAMNSLNPNTHLMRIPT